MEIKNQYIIERSKLKDFTIEDIEGRDIFIAFNEPQFKFASKKETLPSLDSKLNARLITHFLPAIHIAQKMKRRPRLFIVSGINMALLRNAKTEEEKKIMLANNMIKIDFLKCFFESYYKDTFSIVEFVISQDVLKISENTIQTIWELLEDKELNEIKAQLARFLYPKEFNQGPSQNPDNITQKVNLFDLKNAFKYAVSHVFVFGDINFQGNYIHNPKGYVSLGNEHEKYFNVIRDLVYNKIGDTEENIFGKTVIKRNNIKIVIQDAYNIPPPYNGFYKNVGAKNNRKIELQEVTYENGKDIDFYNSVEKLTDQITYIYKNFIPKQDYKKFRNHYKERYFDLKKRYKEAYNIEQNW